MMLVPVCMIEQPSVQACGFVNVSRCCVQLNKLNWTLTSFIWNIISIFRQKRSAQETIRTGTVIKAGAEGHCRTWRAQIWFCRLLGNQWTKGFLLGFVVGMWKLPIIISASPGMRKFWNSFGYKRYQKATNSVISSAWWPNV